MKFKGELNKSCQIRGAPNYSAIERLWYSLIINPSKPIGACFFQKGHLSLRFRTFKEKHVNLLLFRLEKGRTLQEKDMHPLHERKGEGTRSITTYLHRMLTSN